MSTSNVNAGRERAPQRSFARIYVMLDIETKLKSDEHGFLYLEYLGKRLMTFRGEQKLILMQLIKQAEEEIANEATLGN